MCSKEQGFYQSSENDILKSMQRLQNVTQEERSKRFRQGLTEAYLRDEDKMKVKITNKTGNVQDTKMLLDDGRDLVDILSIEKITIKIEANKLIRLEMTVDSHGFNIENVEAEFSYETQELLKKLGYEKKEKNGQ